MDCPAVVEIREQRVELEDHDLAVGQRSITVRGEAADAVVYGGRLGGVVDVDVVIGGEIRIEGHSEQAALARRVDVERQKRRLEQGTVLDDAQVSGLFAD